MPFWRRSMGTNYSCRDKTRNSKERHIGKKSCRWSFIFHGYEELGFSLKSYTEWKKYLLDSEVKIYDEYGKKISPSK